MDNKVKFKTRIAAVQVIFQSLINQKNISNIKDEFDNFYRNKILDTNIDKIEYNVILLSKLIDYYISTSLDFDFNIAINKIIKFDRVFEKWDLINKSIIMMAISELKNCSKNKHKIIINDYIELSKFFINTRDIKILNAILDKFINEEFKEE